ncbi:MAG: aspartate kinase, partial [Acidobacteria bacterium]
DLAARFATRATLREGVGAVSAIGAGINARFANLRRALETLSSMGATVLGASTSSFRISVLLAEKDVPEAVRRLHVALVTEGERPRSPAD